MERTKQEIVRENEHYRMILFKVFNIIKEIDFNISDCSDCIHESFDFPHGRICNHCENGSHKEIDTNKQ